MSFYAGYSNLDYPSDDVPPEINVRRHGQGLATDQLSVEINTGMQTALWQMKVSVAVGLSRALVYQRLRDRGQRLGADAHFGMS